ncbi:MAG: acyl--CoA ligase [Rhodospirillaceae bacterium]|nr:acyl--CoA ligase [Rhodospirillaceae bacterium]
MTTLSPADPRYHNLGYFSWEAARRRPDKVALIDLSRTPAAEIAYGTLDERLDRFAALTRALGLGPGDRLAMAVGNRFEFIEVMYGAMRAGVVPVPLNTRLGADVLDYVMRDASCVAAVVEPATNLRIVEVVERLGLRHRLAMGEVPPGWQAYEAALQAAPPRFEPPALAGDHPSFQPYTSGSTGRPKGVILTHAGQMWWIRACQRYWPLQESDRALTAVPLYHKNAMAGAIKTFLHAGASTVILPNFEPRRFLETLSRYRCTHTGGVPAVFTRLLQQKDLIASLDFSALKAIKIGSAPTARELQEAVEAAFGVPVGESYGLTEGGPVMIGPPIDGRKVPKGSCGVAWPEGEVKLVGPDGRESDSDGELWVRNPGVTPGYHNLPEVNRERLVDGWLRTGDLFHRDRDGFFYFRGRTDDMFNCGGENIYPLEVEGLLLTHPDVADVSVVPFPHAVKGEAPVAVVVRRKGSAVTEEELRRFALERGPAYAHPRRVLFVDALPLNGAAKTDRAEVKKLVMAALGATPLGQDEAR